MPATRFSSRTVILLPAILTALLGAVTLAALRQEARDARAVMETHDAIAGARGVLVRLLEAESAVRAYVIAGREEYLASYEQLRRDADSILRELRQIEQSLEASTRRAQDLNGLVAARIAILDEQVRRASARPALTTRDAALLDAGWQLGDSLRTVIASLDEQAHVLRESRVSTGERRTRVALATVTATVVIVLALSVLLTSTLVAAARSEAQHAAELEQTNYQLAERNAQLAEREVELETQTERLSDQAVELEMQTDELATRARALEEQTEIARESEERYRAILESVSDGVILHAQNGSVLAVNRSAERMLGLTPEELGGGVAEGWRCLRPDTSEIPAEDLPHRRALVTGEPQQPALILVERPAAPLLWLYVTSVPVRLQGGNGVVTTFADVTQLREMQGELERDRRFFDSILESMDEAVIACDASGRLNFFNRAARELSPVLAQERDPSEWSTRYAFLSVDGAELSLEEVPLHRALHGEVVNDFEMVLVPPDAPRRRVVAAARPLTAGRERLGAVVILRDVTATRTAQAQLQEADERLRQTQKMEAIGQLAGGIAHDFNNLLTAITSYSELARENIPGDNPAAADVAEILEAAERARVLTRQLLAFSRRQAFELRPLDLNERVARAEKLISRLIPAQIDVRLQTASKPLVVECDPVQLEQVLINLAVNGRDAITGKGTILFETSEAVLDEESAAQLPDLEPGRYALLAVTDTGAGMDAETQARIFEPFFTTKPAGRGTGLGLSTVYGIVRQSRGTIVVYSERGHGTTFRIYLPLSDEEAVAGASPVVRPDVHGEDTILVVDDEEPVRDVIRRILETRGFTVVEAGNGREALAVARAHSEPIDLVISDLVMPAMGGRELADTLRRDRPSLPFIFISGYTAGAVKRQVSGGRKTLFVEKPFTSAALLAAVAAALNGDRKG